MIRNRILYSFSKNTALYRQVQPEEGKRDKKEEEANMWNRLIIARNFSTCQN